MKATLKNRGEALTLALVGLLVGSVMLYINTGNEAQSLANSSGRTIDQWEIISNSPGKSAATVLLPATAGWGIGYALDKVAGNDSTKSQDMMLELSDNDAPITITITGNPTTTTDTHTDNSVR